MVSSDDVVVVTCGFDNVDGEEDGLKKRQDDNCNEHDVCMKGEELVALWRWKRLENVVLIVIGKRGGSFVDGGPQDVSGGSPPKNDGMLKDSWEDMYVVSGAIRVIGELMNELESGVARYFIHVLNEDVTAWPS